jgi:endonuclease/exonuclease/phosphatase family metal-dependent hydrolase
MKIMFLNLNYGRNDLAGILNFIEKDFDVLCFQEIKDEVKNEIDNKLVKYENSFISKEFKVSEGLVKFNLTTYLSKKFHNYEFEIFEDNLDKTAPSILLKINEGNSKYNILNFHGNPYPGDKLDTENRIKASQNIISITENLEGSKIIGGDFNLFPETKSIKLIEEAGFKNLIKIYQIKTTRNENAWKLYENKQLFADFVFVSNEVEIKNFEVIQNNISDHLPLILEI